MIKFINVIGIITGILNIISGIITFIASFIGGFNWITLISSIVTILAGIFWIGLVSILSQHEDRLDGNGGACNRLEKRLRTLEKEKTQNEALLKKQELLLKNYEERISKLENGGNKA